MRILNDAKDKVVWALDFANLDLDTDAFGPGDRLNLEREFSQYYKTNDGVLAYLWSITIFVGTPWKHIQSKFRRFLDSLVEENRKRTLTNEESIKEQQKWNEEWLRRMEELRKPRQKRMEDSNDKLPVAETQIKIGVTGLPSLVGRADDLFIFKFLMLISKLSARINRCPLCRKYYLKRKNKRFCTPRCQVNWANRKYYRNQQIKKEILRLRTEEGLSEKTIIKRLRKNRMLKIDDSLDETKVRSWIPKNRIKEKPAPVNRSKTKRR